MSRRRGFTLIELLVSLVILGLVSLTMAAALSEGGTARRRILARIAPVEDVAAVQDVLRFSLSQLTPVTRPAGGTPIVDISGTARSVKFFAPPPLAGRPAALNKYWLRVRANGDLALSSASIVTVPKKLDPLDPASNAPDAELTWRDHVLMRGVQSLELAYYGPTRDGTGWQDVWRLRTGIPTLIRVRARFQDGDPRIWPDLIVHPVATLDTACVLDPSSGGCRGRS